ncbi:hypothetical protein ASF25_01675 [Methylobacterium sp. Leaf100]|nr:hypothetical protein ASF25_01675 [Methylobacterium sp. Leaf100]
MPDQVVERGLRVLQAQQALAVETVHLALAVQMAWWDLWVRPAVQASAESKASRDRTARLVRRGIPARLARQGLRVV